jgi:hypothetical protein
MIRGMGDRMPVFPDDATDLTRLLVVGQRIDTSGQRIWTAAGMVTGSSMGRPQRPAPPPRRTDGMLMGTG